MKKAGVAGTLALEVQGGGDRDGDGLPDVFEENNAVGPGGTNLARLPGVQVIASSSAGGRPASAVIDGNLQEFNLGTSIFLSDTDADGLLDGEEVDLGSDPLVADSDGDGLVDGTASGTVLDNLRTWGGSHQAEGGAGTIYLESATSSFGDLLVDNNGVIGETTELPALGSGVAQAGSSGALLVTDRRVDIPAYLVGHRVQISAGGTPTGDFRILAVDGITATLEAAANVAEGDLWEGVYRFDSVSVLGGGNLTSVDLIDSTNPFSDTSSANSQRPWIDPSAVTVTVGEIPGTWRIEVPLAAVADADGVSEIRLAGAESWTSVPFSPRSGASVIWLGEVGEELDLVVLDAHESLRRGARTRLEALPDNGGLVAEEALPSGEPQPRLAQGNGYLLAAYADRLVVADPSTGEAWTLPFAAGESFVELVVDDMAAALAVRTEVEDDEDEIRAIKVPLTGGVGVFERWRHETER